MSNALNIGRIKQFHFAIEPNFGDGVPQSAATLIQALDGSTLELQKRELQENPASNGTRDANDQINGRHQEIPFSIESHALMMPDAATASNIEPMLLAALGATAARVTPDDQTALAGSTTTMLKVTDATSYQLFDGMVVEGNIAFVTKVNTGTNELTISPPLLAVPAVGAALSKTRTLHLADTQPTIGVDAKFDYMTLRGGGGVIKTLAFDTTGKEGVKLKLSGVLASQTITSRAALTAAVATTGATSFTVDNPHAFEAGSLFDINGETNVLVLSVDSTAKTITVSRGANPAAHANGDTLTPAWVGGTVAGGLAHGSSGRARRGDKNGVAVSIPAVSRSFNIETGSELINDEDGGESPSYNVDGARKVTGNRTLHLRELDLKWLREGATNDKQPELYEMAAGSRKMAIFFPRAGLAVPSLNEGTQRDLTQEFTASFAQDADGNNVANRVVVMALC